MKRLIGWAIRLYPRAWRERYGAEVEALAEDSGASVAGVGNLVAGAAAMRLRTSSWRPVAAFAVAGLAAAGGLALRIPVQYESEATVLVKAGQGGDVAKAARTLRLRALSSSAMGSLVTAVRAGLPADMPPDDAAAEMGKGARIVLEPRDGGVVARISYRGTDARVAREMADHLMRLLYVANSFEIAMSGQSGNRLDIVKAPTAAHSVHEPLRWIVPGFGLAAGLALGLSYLLAQRRVRLVRAGAIAVLAIAGLSFAWPLRYTSTAELLFPSASVAEGALKRASAQALGMLESVDFEAGTGGSVVVRASSRDRRRAHYLAYSTVAQLLYSGKRGKSDYREVAELVESPELPLPAELTPLRLGLLLVGLALALIGWSPKRAAPAEVPA